MKNKHTYVKLTEDEEHSPSENELMLDNYSEAEYNTPYTTYGEDTFDVGGVIEAGGIFDDR